MPGLWMNALLAVSTLLSNISIAANADARGGMRLEDPWAAAHIEGLPPDIRRDLSAQGQICGGLRARHDFSRYLSPRGSKYSFVSLHFEHFGCNERAAICTSRGCLHQVYASAGAGYRLVFSARVRELELKVLDGAPAVEISCSRFGENCPRVLRWNGGAFVGR